MPRRGIGIPVDGAEFGRIVAPIARMAIEAGLIAVGDLVEAQTMAYLAIADIGQGRGAVYGPRFPTRRRNVRVGIVLVAGITGDPGKPAVQIGPMAFCRASRSSVLPHILPMRICPIGGMDIDVTMTGITVDAADPALVIAPMTDLAILFTLVLTKLSVILRLDPTGGMGIQGMTACTRHSGEATFEIRAVALRCTGRDTPIYRRLTMGIRPLIGMRIEGVAGITGRRGLLFFGTDLMANQTDLKAVLGRPDAVQGWIYPSSRVGKKREA